MVLKMTLSYWYLPDTFNQEKERKTFLPGKKTNQVWYMYSVSSGADLLSREKTKERERLLYVRVYNLLLLLVPHILVLLRMIFEICKKYPLYVFFHNSIQIGKSQVLRNLWCATYMYYSRWKLKQTFILQYVYRVFMFSIIIKF